jgi:MFS family permease
VSYLGDSMALVALLVHVQGRTGAAFAVAALLLAGDCVPGLLAPLVGALADRLPPRAILVCGEFVQGGLVLSMALLIMAPTSPVPALPTLLGLVAGQGLVAAVVRATARASVPRHVADADLDAANAALGVGGYGMEAAGPLLAAVLLSPIGTPGVLLLDAATFAAAALLLMRLPKSAAAGGTSSSPGVRLLLREAVEGVGYLWRSPVLRRISLGFLGVVLFSGVDDVALVFLVTDELGGGATAAAAAYAAAGIGLIGGYLFLGSSRTSRLPGLAAFVAGLALGSAGNLATGLAGSVAVAFAWQAVRGVGVAATDVALSSHVHRSVPAAWQGRAFGNLYGGAGLVAGVSYLAGGVCSTSRPPG